MDTVLLQQLSLWRVLSAGLLSPERKKDAIVEEKHDITGKEGRVSRPTGPQPMTGFSGACHTHVSLVCLF